MNINLHGEEQSRDEYACAEQIRDIFEKEFASEQGELHIFSDFIITDEKRTDIDVFVAMHSKKGIDIPLKTLSTAAKDKIHNDFSKQIDVIRFYSFAFCVEVKSHDLPSIQFTSNEVNVLYNDKPKNVRKQSEEQKYGLVRYFRKHWKSIILIDNFIYFKNLRQTDIPEHYGNIWGGIDLNFKTLTSHLVTHSKHETKGSNIPNTIYYSSLNLYHDRAHARWDEEVTKAYSSFIDFKASVGKLTRNKVENLSKGIINKNYMQEYAKKIGICMVVIEGKAGTGKTIKLLRIAKSLMDEGKRCLFLTYNKALVSDIRRLLDLMRIRNDDSSGTIIVRSIHSFMMQIYKELIDDEIDFDNYIRELGGFDEMYTFVKGEILKYVNGKAIKNSDLKNDIAWDILLIDEGQDWPEDEKEILVGLYKSENIIVADGINQMVRGYPKCNWQKGTEPPPHTSRYGRMTSLRQKSNLCTFINRVAESMERERYINPTQELSGGKIIISNSFNQNDYNELLDNCLKNENKPYEILFLVPPKLVGKNALEPSLERKLNQYEIKYWDGTNKENRELYTTNIEELRILQYDSCRGLEGWSVICYGIDSFFDYKYGTFREVEAVGQLEINFENPEQRRLKFAYDWLFAPLTRAIDTLFIKLDNPNSEISQLLLKAAKGCEDFVTINIE